MDQSQTRLFSIKLLENWGKLEALAKLYSRGVVRSQDGEGEIRTHGGDLPLAGLANQCIRPDSATSPL